MRKHKKIRVLWQDTKDALIVLIGEGWLEQVGRVHRAVMDQMVDDLVDEGDLVC